MAEYDAIQGQSIQLNCNLTTFTAEDAIQLVFWYKGESNKPIYSVDARNPSRPRHFNYFAVQALKVTSFNTTSASKSSSFSSSIVLADESAESGQLRRLAERLSLTHNFSLRIDRLSREDGGLYRCRVDFRYARTLNTLMRLHVIGKRRYGYCSIT
jgi:hypothetical protein